MSKWNMDPEVVYITGGSIEVHPVERVPVHRGRSPRRWIGIARTRTRPM